MSILCEPNWMRKGKVAHHDPPGSATRVQARADPNHQDALSETALMEAAGVVRRHW